MPTPYFFILGTTPALSKIELGEFFSGSKVEEVADSVCKVEVSDEITVGEMMFKLGGVVKIAKLLTSVERDITDKKLYKEITSQLTKYAKAEKVTFGLAEFGRNHLPALSIEEIKDQLKAKDLRARYIEGPRYGLSAAILLHRSVSEIVVIRTEEDTVIAITEAVQDIDAWTKIDREKPYADRKKGMLPPKIARIMINLACGRQPNPEAIVFDPFCGSGTVLMEAAARGLEVVGSDLDIDAVNGTIKNLEWFTEQYAATFDFSVIQADATKVKLNKRVDYLVTEPFLGKPKPAPHQIDNIFKGLEKMYLGAFKHWRTILKPGARVVIIFPRALAATMDMRRDVTLDVLIDKLKALGYTPLLEPVLYHRPQALIGREIRVFEFQPIESAQS